MSTDDLRPDPDRLLAAIKREEQLNARGKLRIFLGMAPGVGKTFSMLETARIKQQDGVDILAGVVETHHRPETEDLLVGFDLLPRRIIEYHGHELTEFDLDAALERKPGLILVDELAHTNAPGSRHGKRWQDVVELLDHGIDVWSTLNVQHVESLNDVVAQITGVRVRETVPDSVLEQADSVVLVDLPPDDLRKRLKEGKVYIPQQAEWAANNFFREGNLTALRELALRATAQRVNTEVLVYRHGRSIQTTWPTSERILVCVGPSPSSARLVRAAKRLAAGLRAPWMALFIQGGQAKADIDQALSNLRLAEELGAETFVLSGQNVAQEIVGFARQHNVSKLVIGKPVRRRLRDYLFGSPVERLLLISEEIDVHVIRGDSLDAGPRRTAAPLRKPFPWVELLWAALIVVACTALCFVMYPYFELANLIMVYLLGVMMVALWFSRGASVAASLLSVLAFDFFFVPPRFTFAVTDVHYVVTFGVMFCIANVMSSMASQIKRQAEHAGAMERQTASLAALGRELSATRGVDAILAVSQRHISDVFEHHVYFLMPDATGRLRTKAKPPGSASLHGKEMGVAEWVQGNSKRAGLGTQTLPDSELTFLPLIGAGGVVGVAGLKPALPQAANALALPEQQRLLDAFIGQIALALEVDRLEDEAKGITLEIESEKLRSSLLSAVTHDFQTPLAVIAGSAESLLVPEIRENRDTVVSLAQNIHGEAGRLSRLVNNLLRIVSLEHGDFKPNLTLTPIEEVIGSALSRVSNVLEDRQVKVDIDPRVPPIPMDVVLMEQLFINLLENAAKYSPKMSTVGISVGFADETTALITVSDEGEGLDADELEKIFNRFYRGKGQDKSGGYGLGLAICRAIARVHAGSIKAINMVPKGFALQVQLPLSRTTA